jgi:hypothetical protein
VPHGQRPASVRCPRGPDSILQQSVRSGGGAAAAQPRAWRRAGGDAGAAAAAAGVVAVSCALFGVTYRYAVRGQETNLQLKGGVVAAFGLVRQTVQPRPDCFCPCQAGAGWLWRWR